MRKIITAAVVLFLMGLIALAIPEVRNEVRNACDHIDSLCGRVTNSASSDAAVLVAIDYPVLNNQTELAPGESSRDAAHDGNLRDVDAIFVPEGCLGRLSYGPASTTLPSGEWVKITDNPYPYTIHVSCYDPSS